MDNYKQVILNDVPFDEDCEDEVCFIPDFNNVDKLYKQFGINNDIDLALQKPQYRDIINQRLAQLPVSSSPSLSDRQLADNMVSREYDVNELREIAINQANEYNKTKRK